MGCVEVGGSDGLEGDGRAGGLRLMPMVDEAIQLKEKYAESETAMTTIATEPTYSEWGLNDLQYEARPPVTCSSTAIRSISSLRSPGA